MKICIDWHFYLVFFTFWIPSLVKRLRSVLFRLLLCLINLVIEYITRGKGEGSEAS